MHRSGNTRLHRHTLISALSLFTIAIVSLTASARAAPDQSGDVRSALATESRMRPLLEQGSLGSAIEAVAVLDAVTLDDEHDGPLPTQVEGVELPERLRSPILTILGAATEAGRVASASVDAPDLSSVLDAVRAARLSRADGASQPAEPLLDPARVDRPELIRAAWLVARAIDAAMPTLKEQAAERPASSASVDGCDVVDALPLVCVGSEASNAYTDNALVHVDLGGDDLYASSAGGAGPVPDRSPAAVVIDLGGDDRYDVSSRNQAWGAQGVGVDGGVGFLVDVEGDDSYRHWLGQGIGIFGVGVFADLSGNDRYTLDSRLGPFAEEVLGAGSALLGIGVFLDQGGDDTLSAIAEPRRRKKRPPHPSVNIAVAYGDAFDGVALAWDRGGSDRAEIVARDRSPGDVFALAEGFGVGWGSTSAGFALSGDGDTKRRMKIDVNARSSAVDGVGMGAGPFGGLGFLGDAAGNDTYEVQTKVRTERMGGVGVMALAAADGNSAVHDASGDDHYLVKVVGINEGAPRPTWFDVSAMGSSLFGHGLLTDAGGDDVYEARIDNDGVVPRRLFSARVQGAGQAGAGQLTDLGGADRYIAVARPGNDRSSRSLPLSWLAQGAGLGGALLDLDDGRTDRFTLSPSRSVCFGARGSGTWWIECDEDGFGAGVGAVLP